MHKGCLVQLQDFSDHWRLWQDLAAEQQPGLGASAKVVRAPLPVVMSEPAAATLADLLARMGGAVKAEELVAIQYDELCELMRVYGVTGVDEQNEIRAELAAIREAGSAGTMLPDDAGDKSTKRAAAVLQNLAELCARQQRQLSDIRREDGSVVGRDAHEPQTFDELMQNTLFGKWSNTEIFELSEGAVAELLVEHGVPYSSSKILSRSVVATAKTRRELLGLPMDTLDLDCAVKEVRTN